MNYNEIRQTQQSGIAIHPMKTGDPRYKRVYQELVTTAGANPSWKIDGIYILRNNQRKAGSSSNRRGDFENKKKKYGGRSLWLFHGTPPQNLCSIVASTLNPSVSGAYGPGIYFSPNASIASGYALKTGSSHGYILSCIVSLGKNYSKNRDSHIQSYDALSHGGSPGAKDKHDSWVFLVRSSEQVYIRFITCIRR